MYLHMIGHKTSAGKGIPETMKTVGPVGKLFPGREYLRRQFPGFLHQRLRIASQNRWGVILCTEYSAGGIACECGTEAEQGFRLLLWRGVSKIISTEDVLAVCRTEFTFRKQGLKNSVQTRHGGVINKLHGGVFLVRGSNKQPVKLPVLLRAEDGINQLPKSLLPGLLIKWGVKYRKVITEKFFRDDLRGGDVFSPLSR